MIIIFAYQQGCLSFLQQNCSLQLLIKPQCQIINNKLILKNIQNYSILINNDIKTIIPKYNIFIKQFQETDKYLYLKSLINGKIKYKFEFTSSQCKQIQHGNKKQYKIGMIYSFVHGGGIQNVNKQIAKILIKNHHKVSIIISKKFRQFEGEPLPKEIEIVQLFDAYNKIEYQQNWEYFKQFDFFILHAHFDKYSNDLLKFLSQQHINTIQIDHNCFFEWYYRKSQLIQNDFQLINEPAHYTRFDSYPYASAIVTLSYPDQYIWNKIVNNAICFYNPLMFEMNKTLTEKPKNVIWVGRHEDFIKQINIAIQIFKNIKKQLPLTEFYICGDSKISNLPDYIHSTGQVQNVYDYYDNSSVLIQTSLHEGQPTVIQEALSRGVVPVTFNLSYLLFTEYIPITIKNDIENMTKEVVNLLQNESYRQQWIKLGQEKLLKNSKKISQRWEKLLFNIENGLQIEKNFDEWSLEKTLDSIQAELHDVYENSKKNYDLVAQLGDKQLVIDQQIYLNQQKIDFNKFEQVMKQNKYNHIIFTLDNETLTELDFNNEENYQYSSFGYFLLLIYKYQKQSLEQFEKSINCEENKEDFLTIYSQKYAIDNIIFKCVDYTLINK